MTVLLSWVASGLVVLSLIMLSLAVYGVLSMPDVYSRVHAASKTVALGILPLLLAASLNGDPAIISRSVLIAVFLILTTPISAHAIVRAVYLNAQNVERRGVRLTRESVSVADPTDGDGRSPDSPWHQA